MLSLLNTVLFSEINNSTTWTSRTSKLTFVKSVLVTTKLIWSLSASFSIWLPFTFSLLTPVSTLVLAMFKGAFSDQKVHLVIKIIKMSELSCATNHRHDRRCNVWSVDYYHNCFSTCSKSWKAAHVHKLILERKNSSYLFSILSALFQTTENWIRLWVMVVFEIARFPKHR